MRTSRMAGVSMATFLMFSPADSGAFYHPQQGRWLARDPLGEQASLSTSLGDKSPRERGALRSRSLEPVYLFVRNSPVLTVDYLGLEYLSPGCVCVAGSRFGTAETAAAISLGLQAEREADAAGFPGADGGPRDAVRHCTWTCLMARDSRTPDFLAFGHFYEDCTGDSGASRAMDESNNLRGALLSSQPGSCIDVCSQAFVDGLLTTLPPWSP